LRDKAHKAAEIVPVERKSASAIECIMRGNLTNNISLIIAAQQQDQMV